MALNKLKKFVTEEVMDEVSEDEYYDAEKVTIPSGTGKMILLEPRAYSESQQIADHLKKRNTVVVNMKRVTPDQAKRIVDFLSGTVYAIGGELQKIGGGIFLFITLIGGLIYGKEAMGFGDVKLMGALGLFFGQYNIIAVTLVSFLIGAILSIILLVSKIKKSDEYIPFGPFIVIASFISMYVPFEQIKLILLKIFTLGLYTK